MVVYGGYSSFAVHIMSDLRLILSFLSLHSPALPPQIVIYGGVSNNHYFSDLVALMWDKDGAPGQEDWVRPTIGQVSN